MLGGIEVFSHRVIGINIKRRLYEGVAVPTALYETKTKSMAVVKIKKVKCNGDEVSEKYV